MSHTIFYSTGISSPAGASTSSFSAKPTKTLRQHRRYQRIILVNEAEVQPLIPFVNGSLKVVRLLVSRQLLPLPLLGLVAPDVIIPHSNIQEDVIHRDRNQGAVAFPCTVP